MATKSHKRFNQSICAFCAFLWLLIVVNSAAAQSNQSVYTSLGAKQCREIKSAEAGDDGYEGRCPGVAGYKLLLSEGDLRQNITVITPKGAQHSLDLWDVISGGFSSVGPRAEWRMAMQNGKLSPVALIVRYNASENAEDSSKITSYLVVVKITKNAACVTDVVDPGKNQNVEARQLADGATNKPCYTRK